MARLHEYQGKEILASNGFKIPRGRAAVSSDDAVAAATRGTDGWARRAAASHSKGLDRLGRQVLVFQGASPFRDRVGEQLLRFGCLV